MIKFFIGKISASVRAFEFTLLILVGCYLKSKQCRLKNSFRRHCLSAVIKQACLNWGMKNINSDWSIGQHGVYKKAGVKRVIVSRSAISLPWKK